MAVAHIFVNGVIGGDFFDLSGEDMGTTLADVRRQYNSFEAPESATVHINSVGGDYFEGMAIHDFLRGLNIPVTTIGVGKIFSIATVILLAGDTREMTPNAEFMVHNPMSYAGEYGDAEKHEEIANQLREYENRLANFYAGKTGQPVEMLRDMMNAETFLSAQDAQTLGFIDRVREPVKAVAYFRETNISNSMSTDAKDRNKLVADLRKLLGMDVKNEAVEVEEPETEVTAEVEAAPVVDEAAQLREKVAELEAQLAEANKAREDAETVRDEQAAQIQAQEDKINAIMAKVEELENMPVVVAKEDVTKTVVKETEDEGAPKPFEGIAAFFRQTAVK